MKKTAIAAALGLLVAGCAGGSGGGASADEYEKVVSQAEAEMKVASKMGFLWNNTDKFLKESKEAKEKGEMDKALKLAKKALREAQLAQQQAKDQASPSFPF